MTISPGNFEATNQEPTNNDLAKDQKEIHEQNPDVREFPRRAIAVFYADTIGEETGKEDHAAFNEVFSFMSSDIREKDIRWIRLPLPLMVIEQSMSFVVHM